MRALLSAAMFAVSALGADVIVASDGSGQFKTVQEAVNAAPANTTSNAGRFVIHIGPGIYKERIVVPRAKSFISLIGEDAKTTILTNDLYASIPGNDGKPIGTFRTPSTTIEADDFIAENITFENSAGAVGQAVALAVFGDRAVFRNCRFLGWQDTLLAQSGRQYFENSYIEGAVDFIFGGSTAYFDNCRIHCKGNGYITAASTPHDQPYGYVFSRCKITGQPAAKSYLGRPWRDFASVIFLNTEMSEAIRPAGWHNWDKPEREKTSRYAEYRSSGSGANAGDRAAWSRQLSDEEAARISIASVLGGMDDWNPKTGIAHADKVFELMKEEFTPLRLYAAIKLSIAEKQIMYSFSFDREKWSTPRLISVAAPDRALDMQNPGGFYDRASRRFIIWWASTIAENFFQSYQEPVEDNPRLWYTITRDFESFAPAKVLFDPGYSVRFGRLVKNGDGYALIHEDSRSAVKQLRVAFSEKLTGPWGPSSDSLGVLSETFSSTIDVPREVLKILP